VDKVKLIRPSLVSLYLAK